MRLEGLLELKEFSRGLSVISWWSRDASPEEWEFAPYLFLDFLREFHLQVRIWREILVSFLYISMAEEIIKTVRVTVCLGIIYL